MAQYKVLKSIAHNFGHSFISLMNYMYDDYMMGHIVKAARVSGQSRLILNILSKSWEPTELITPIIAKNLEHKCNYFPQLVISSNSKMECIQDARMDIFIDLNRERPNKSNPEFIENYFELVVEIIDDRGKSYRTEFKDWWYPEN